MSGVRYGILFAAVFILSLAAMAPAWLLRSSLPLPPGVQLAPLHGSLWRGEASWLAYDGYQVESLKWRFAPFGLLSGEPLWVSVEKPVAIDGRLGPGFSGDLSASDVSASTAVSTVLDYLSLPGLGVDADIAVSVDEAKLVSAGCKRLRGRVSLSEWRGELDGVSSIGPITGRLACDNGQLLIEVNPDNAVNLKGSVRASADGNYRVDLRLAPPPGPLYDSLEALLGTPRNGREFRLQARS